MVSIRTSGVGGSGSGFCGGRDNPNRNPNPPPEFEENSKQPLIDISLIDSIELWLIQLPSNQPLDFDGQEVSLKLTDNGKLGEFTTSSGKSYELVASQESDATVFLSSPSHTKIVGKVSRRVSLLHYPEPSELEEASYDRSGRMYEKSAGSFSASASRQRYLSSKQGSRQKTAGGISHFTTSSLHGSRHRSSSLFEGGESSQRLKKRHVNEPSISVGLSNQDSRGKSDITYNSAGHSGMKN